MKTTQWDFLKKAMRHEAGLPLDQEGTVPHVKSYKLDELTEVLFSEVEVTVRARSSRARARGETCL